MTTPKTNAVAGPHDLRIEGGFDFWKSKTLFIVRPRRGGFGGNGGGSDGEYPLLSQTQRHTGRNKGAPECGGSQRGGNSQNGGLGFRHESYIKIHLQAVVGGCLVTLLVIGGAFAASLQHIAGTTGIEKVVHQEDFEFLFKTVH